MPYWTDRPKPSDEDLIALGRWQQKHLRVQWGEVLTPWELEAEVIAQLRPPLNHERNVAHRFYVHVGEARARLRTAARTGTAPT